MKKGIFVSIHVLMLLMVGCGARTTSSTETSTNQTVEITTTSESAVITSETTISTSQPVESSETSTSSEESNSSSTEAPSESSTETEPENAQSELSQLYPNVAFPKDISHTEGNALNIAVAGDEDKLSVLYFDMSTPLIVNKKELNHETPIAQYQQEVFPSAQEAKEAVNLKMDMNGMKVDLGYGITGYQQGAAGSSYIAWQEGNWNLVVRASNVMEQDPLPVAKEIVEYLEIAMLPAPEEIGQITVDLVVDGYRGNEVIWQVDNEMYAVRHEDPMAALRMAVSIIE